MLRLGPAWAGLTVLCIAGPAVAQDSETAARAFAEARFDDARSAFEAVAASATASTEDLAVAHRYLASLALLFRDQQAAREHARAALSLSPSTEVPEGAPDGTRQLLAQAAAEQGEHPLELRLSLPAAFDAGAPLLVHAHVINAPPPLTGEIELRCELPHASPVETRGGGGSVEIRVDTHSLQAGDRVSCLARARTPGGARVRETRGQGTARVSRVDRSDAGSARSGGGGGAWIWIGTGLVVAAAGVVVGVLAARSAQDIVIGRVEVDGF